jgi:hypothetical protein
MRMLMLMLILILTRRTEMMMTTTMMICTIHRRATAAVVLVVVTAGPICEETRLARLETKGEPTARKDSQLVVVYRPKCRALWRHKETSTTPLADVSRSSHPSRKAALLIASSRQQPAAAASSRRWIVCCCCEEASRSLLRRLTAYLFTVPTPTRSREEESRGSRTQP